MVAAIAGNGLGLGNTSLTQLGQTSGGQASIGQAGIGQYLNLATGNLVLQNADEGLIFDGLALNVLRTYNSLGQLTGNQGWLFGFTRNVGGLTGTLNTAGSTITRTADDGSAVTYAYNATLGEYVSQGQSGAQDTLSSDGSAWTWTDGASRVQETYDASGLLQTLSDPETGASYSFGYNGSQLTTITAGDGDQLTLGYTNGALTSLSISEIPPGGTTPVMRQQVGYVYDGQGRLQSVTTTLGSDTDATSASYTTTYTYDGSSDRIASVTQSDGTTVSYTYAQDGNGDWRVATVTTGTGAAAQTLTLGYTLGTDTTTVTDALGRVSTYTYNAAGQLTDVTAPTVNGSTPTTQYSYDANGNLTQVIDANGGITSYTYDANGNRLSVEDPTGHTISSTYNADNQITSQTTYSVPAQGVVGQAGHVAPSGAQTTYFVYDSSDRLSYVIDALGNVTEHDYGTSSGVTVLSSTKQYVGASYSLTGLSPSTPPTLAQLQSWVASSPVQAVLGQMERTDYSYDVRGQLSQSIQWGALNSAGMGTLSSDTSAVVTNFTYDAQGHLLQQATLRGSARTTAETASYAYDGLGRLISSTDPLNNVTSYVYTDSGNQLAITQANGLTTTQVRNSAGELLSSTQSASVQASRTTSYLYDAAGQSVAVIDAAGNVSYTFYDADGRVSGTVDTIGAVTAYTYDADGHAVATTQCATTISTAGWVSGGALTSSFPTALPVPASNANDRTAYTLYDAAGRLVATVDAMGDVVTTTYDGDGNAIGTTAYATPLATAELTALMNAPQWSTLQATPLQTSSSDRTTRTFYDGDNRVAATVDASGYVTVVTYDAAGRAVKTTAYAAPQSAVVTQATSLAALLSSVVADANDQTTRTYYDNEGRVVAQVDADGYLTTTAYDETTHTTATTRYGTALTSTQLSALTGSETNTTLVALLGASPATQTSTSIDDADGRLHQVTASDGTVTVYSYNTVGQLLSTTATPAAGQGAARTTSTSYDAFGDVTGRTDGNTQTTSYTYNVLGQQVTATDPLGNITYTYYDADGRVAYKVQGQPSGGTLNALGDVIAYTYNAFGQVASTRRYAGVLTLTTSGGSSGTTLNVTSATVDQVAAAAAALANPTTDTTTSYSYTLDGQVAGTIDGLGYQTANTYDAFGDLTQQQQQLSGANSSPTAANSTTMSYSYDARGERTGEIDGVGSSVARTTSMTYDAFGRVTSRTDGNGNEVTYSYDNLGRQISTSQMVQGAARTTQTTYDAFARVVSQTDALGNVTTYQYDLLNHRTTVTTPDGVTMTTVKDAFGDTVAVTDGAGNTTTYTYDGDGRLLTATTPLNEVSANQYDADGHLVQTTDATGHVVTYTYDAEGRALTKTVDPSGLSLQTDYVYDGEGRQLSVTDPMGSVTTYSYDADGNVLTQVQDAGAGGLNLTTTYTYDGEGKSLTVTVGSGTSAARTTQYVYDNLERLSQVIVDPGAGHLNLATAYTYDADNNIVVKTDANGNLTRYVYDEANELAYTVDANGYATLYRTDADGRNIVTRSIGTPLTASQSTSLGVPPTLASANSIIPTLQGLSSDVWQRNVYNNDGQLIYVINPLSSAVKQYFYNAAGQVTSTRTYANRLGGGALGANPSVALIAGMITASTSDIQTWTAYNADGQAVYTIDGAGDVAQSFYDAAGRLIRTIAYATPLTGAQLAQLGSVFTLAQMASLVATSSNDRSTVTSYDNAGRAVFTISPSGAVTQTTYDADGRITSTHAYATRLTSAQLALLGSTPTEAQIAAMVASSGADVVRYNVYDSAGELRYAIDPMGYVTETRYDATGNVVETLAYPSAVATTNETNALQSGTALSWLSSQVGGTTGSNPDSSAEATLFLYDAAGRGVFTIKQIGGGAFGQVMGDAYDANGNLTSQTVYGNTLALSTTQSLSAQLTSASVAASVAGFTNKQTTSYVVDADNQRIYTVDALNNVTQTTYDSLGRVTQTQRYAIPISLPGTLNAATIAAAVTAAGGATGQQLSTTTYGTQGHVLSTGDALGVNATYTYNALGEKISSTNRDGDVWNYAYDAAGRLVQTQSPAVTVGSYNGNGALQSTANLYLYTTNVYDAFGEVVSTSQGYGASASAITNVAATAYGYDADGHRVQVTGPLGSVTTTTYNGLGQPVVSRDSNGHYSYSVYNADGQLIDHVDANGYLTAYSYDAYGNLASSTQYATALNAGAITGWSAGQPISAAQVQQGLMPSAGDRTMTTTYDQLNRKVQVVQPSIAYDLSMGELGGTATTGSPTTNYTYDAYGNATSVSRLVQGAMTVGATTTPAVWATTYTYYDALNRAVMVVVPAGSYTAPSGYVTTTAYTAFGQVAASTQYAQSISTSGITAATMPGLPGVATTTSGANRITTFTYDAIGRVLTETDAGSYNASGGTVGQLNWSVGYTTVNSVTSYAYNGENQVTTQTVNGATTTTTYDALGRALTVTAPARQVLVSNWQSLLASTPADDLTTAALYISVSPVTSYVYNALGDALSTTVSAGGLAQQSYANFDSNGNQIESVDADGNVRINTYDGNGNLLTQSYALVAGVTVTTVNTYDADNQLLSTSVQRSGVSTFDSYVQQQYDAFGEVVVRGDNNGHEATYTYNATGQQISAPDSHGAIHSYTYDLVGDLVMDESVVTGGTSTTSTYSAFDLSGRVTAQLKPATNAAAGAVGTPVTMSYDRWGNLTSATDANGGITSYQYDSQNHRTQQTEASVLVVSATGAYTWVTPTKEWYYNVEGQLVGTTDENGNSSWYAYNAEGQQTIAHDNLGAATYTAYDALGRVVATQTPPVKTITGSQSEISFTNYNNLNQVTGQGYFQLNSAGTARTQVTQGAYVLDINGDRLQSTDGLGHTITYTYDSQGRVLTSVTPQHETTTYVYDVNGNLIHQTDADGNSQSWTYSYYRQVLTHTDESAANYTYTYDASSGLLTTETSDWTPTGPSSGTTSTLNFSYEANGALAGLTETVASGSSTVMSTYGYGYDANGNETLETISTQDGGGNAINQQIVAGYDSHNRLQEVTDENAAGTVATMRSAYVYDADGNRRAVFTRSAFENGGAATPISLTNGGPTLGSTLAAQSVSPGSALSYTVASNFNDPLGMGLSFTATGMPSWLSLNSSTGTFTGTPPVPTAPTSYTVTVAAMDVLGHSVTSTFTVTVPTVNPVLASAPSNQTAQPGSAWSYVAPAATDGNGFTVTYSASGMPPGVSFNATTRTFSGTPSTGGSYTVTYTATSSANTKVSATFVITVPNVAPTFTAGVSNQTVQPGSSLNYQGPTATDANGYTVVYSASGLPPGVSFNASTRTFSGPLTTAGTYTVTYTATSSAGTAASLLFNVTVPAVTPVFSAGVSNQSATNTVAMNNYQAPAATDANGAGITYNATGMPPGISFNASTRTFSGAPTAAGTYTVTYTATASDGPVASTTFLISVSQAPAPVYNGGLPNPKTVPDVQGTTNVVRTWTVPAGTFTSPLGRSLNYSFAFTGPAMQYSWDGSTQTLTFDVPGVTVAQIVNYPFVITATDPVSGMSVSGSGVFQVGEVLKTGPVEQSVPAFSLATASVALPAAAPAPAPAPNVVSDWFTYDADGRVLVADGALQNNQIVITTAKNSASNAYDQAGDLVNYITEPSAGQNQAQQNFYNALGQLTQVQTTAVGGSTYGVYETRGYDADGRMTSDLFFNLPGHQGAGTYNGNLVTFNDAGWVSTATFYTYNADGELTDQSEYAEEYAQNLINTYGTGVASSAYATQDEMTPTAPGTLGANTDGALFLVTDNNYAASTGYGYDADGNLLGYHTITSSNATVVGGSSPTASTVGFQNSYIKQNNLLLGTTTQVPASGSSTVTTSNTYNDLGELASSSGGGQTQVMAYTSGGQLLQKNSTASGGVTTYYESVNENELGSVDTGGNIDVLATTGGYSNSSTGAQNYTVQAGDTLSSLAQAIYGDSNYNYILAEANGLSPTATLTAGMVLKIPQVTTSANASNTYEPYAQGSLLSGSANSLYTAAQILAMSIDAVLDQQSAIAQMVAQVEQQEQAATLARLQAEQMQQQAAQAAQQAAQAQQTAQQAQLTAQQAAAAAQQELQAVSAAQAAKAAAELLVAQDAKALTGRTQESLEDRRQDEADKIEKRNETAVIHGLGTQSGESMGAAPSGGDDDSYSLGYDPNGASQYGQVGSDGSPSDEAGDLGSGASGYGFDFAGDASNNASGDNGSGDDGSDGSVDDGSGSDGSDGWDGDFTDFGDDGSWGGDYSNFGQAGADYSAAVAAYNGAATEYNDALSSSDTAQANYNDALSSVDSAQTAYVGALSFAQSAQNAYASALSSASSVQATYTSGLSDLGTSEEASGGVLASATASAPSGLLDAAQNFQFDFTQGGQGVGTQGDVSADGAYGAGTSGAGYSTPGDQTAPISVDVSPLLQQSIDLNSGADVQDVPQTIATIGSVQQSTYTVQAGDTLSGIAGTSNPATIGMLIQLNGLNGSDIQPGMQLQLGSLDDYSADQVGQFAQTGQDALNADNESVAWQHQSVMPGIPQLWTPNANLETAINTYDVNNPLTQSNVAAFEQAADGDASPYKLQPGDYAGAGLSTANSVLDKFMTWANSLGLSEEAAAATEEAGTLKWAGMDVGWSGVARNGLNIVAGALTIGSMIGDMRNGDNRAATQDGFAGLGAMAGAEAGAVIGAVVGLGVFDAITVPAGILAGSIYGAYKGGQLGTTVYDNGFDGNMNIIMQPAHDASDAINTINSWIYGTGRRGP